MHKFEIHRLRQPVHLGWSEEERSFPQIVTIFCEFEVDSERAGTTDDVADTVDYMMIVGAIDELCQRTRWRLLERMTKELSEMVLARFPKVHCAKIKITKDIVPVAEGISVEYSARREAHADS